MVCWAAHGLSLCDTVLLSAHRQNSAWNFPAIRSWEMERVTTKTMPFPSCGVCSLSASMPTKGHTLILVLHILGMWLWDLWVAHGACSMLLSCELMTFYFILLHVAMTGYDRNSDISVKLNLFANLHFWTADSTY